MDYELLLCDSDCGRAISTLYRDCQSVNTFLSNYHINNQYNIDILIILSIVISTRFLLLYFFYISILFNSRRSTLLLPLESRLKINTYYILQTILELLTVPILTFMSLWQSSLDIETRKAISYKTYLLLVILTWNLPMFQPVRKGQLMIELYTKIHTIIKAFKHHEEDIGQAMLDI